MTEQRNEFDNCVPAVRPTEFTRDLIERIAMDIGKEVVAHVKIMYPTAIEACPSTFPLSLRNCIYNEIIATLTIDVEQIESRLAERKKFRREQVTFWNKMRREAETQ